MRLQRFELHGPTTVEEATALLDRHGPQATLYGGGTELLLLMKLGFAEFRHLIDVKEIEELRGVHVQNGTLSIGAAVTHRELERSPIVHSQWAALSDMERSVGNLRVRNAGTIGGNLCFSDPHSDPATFLLAAGAHLIVRRGGAMPSSIEASDFFLGPYRTALSPGQLLVSIEIPLLRARSGISHQKIALHERPAATVTCLVRVDSGRVAEARLAVGSVGVVPVRTPRAEALLLGLSAHEPEENVLDAAAVASSEEAGAVADANSSQEYKQNLVRVLVKRAFREAVGNVRPTEPVE